MKSNRQTEGLIESILDRSDRAFRELLPMLPKEWLHLNLTMPQLKVTLILFMGGPSRMSTLASDLGVSMATATGVVDRLVDRGLVVREGDPADRRVVICRLSDEGESLISGLWQLSRDQLGLMLQNLSPDQLQLITDALDALVQAGQALRSDGSEEKIRG
jgi:DNA-binding MarR family transcriptional regulator